MPRCDPSAATTGPASTCSPATSARFAATLLSLPGNTSSRPSPRSRITAAVHGPMPLMLRSRRAASALAGAPKRREFSGARARGADHGVVGARKSLNAREYGEGYAVALDLRAKRENQAAHDCACRMQADLLKRNRVGAPVVCAARSWKRSGWRPRCAPARRPRTRSSLLRRWQRRRPASWRVPRTNAHRLGTAVVRKSAPR